MPFALDTAFILGYVWTGFDVTACSSIAAVLNFFKKSDRLRSEEADWIESKLSWASVIMDIESSVFLCLFCPPGVLQINLQLKWSVVSIAFSWNGDW